MTTDHVTRALELLEEAKIRLGCALDTRHSYLLVDIAIAKLNEELVARMLAETSAEIAALVDMHGLIDDVAGDDRRLGFQ